MRLPRRILLLTAVAFGLAACEDPTMTSAITGATIGGVTGAATGSDDSDNRGRVITGAVIGGTAGVINSLNRQAADLRSELGEDIEIRNTGEELILTLPQDLLFAVDSATLRSDLQRDLRAIGANLVNYPDTDVVVVGHTDNTGSASYNQALSERRAESVAEVLLSQGISSDRISIVGRGLTQPVATNETPEGRAQNRRVEIFIRPRGTS